MSSYYAPTMRLYLDRLVDWETTLRLRDGGSPDVESEVGAFRTVLETTAALAAGFERTSREHWEAEAELTEDGGARPPAHIRDAYEQLREAGLVSLMISGEYGGAALPGLLNGFYLEMISRADTSLMTVVGLQAGVAGDIEKYASEELKQAWLPRFTSGEVQGAMDLTEPKAGSDLGGITTRAADQPDGTVRVDGVKIFITNGGAEVHLVLARDADHYDESKGTTNGLSLVLVPRHLPDGSRNGIRVARLEKKLGIHGSPTCELVYDDAPAKLIGERQRGLITYVMALMNGARVGIAAQSLGIAEAAYRLARTYAHSRKQFGVPIERLPAVADLVTDMKIAIEAARALAYDTSRVCDLENNNSRVLEFNKSISPEEAKQRKADSRVFKRLNGMLTPMSKYYCSEMCIRVATDAIQVLGGSGYMKDYPAERYLRDARITTIYEGTSQLQIVAAVRGVCGGGFEKRIEELEQAEYAEPALAELRAKLDEGKALVLKGIAFVKAKGGEYMDLWGRKLVDAASAVIIGHLLLQQAKANDRKKAVARRFIAMNAPTIERDINLVCSDDRSAIDSYELIAGPVPAA